MVMSLTFIYLAQTTSTVIYKLEAETTIPSECAADVHHIIYTHFKWVQDKYSTRTEVQVQLLQQGKIVKPSTKCVLAIESSGELCIPVLEATVQLCQSQSDIPKKLVKSLGLLGKLKQVLNFDVQE